MHYNTTSTFYLCIQGYEVVDLKNNETNYRLVLSDGVHMNSYFYLCTELHNLIVEKQIKYGTILKIDEYRFIDGENSFDHSPRLEKFKSYFNHV